MLKCCLSDKFKLATKNGYYRYAMSVLKRKKSGYCLEMIKRAFKKKISFFGSGTLELTTKLLIPAPQQNIAVPFTYQK